MFNGKINCKWPFSTAILSYQKVYLMLFSLAEFAQGPRCQTVARRTEKSWEKWWESSGLPWENHRKTMGKPWGNGGLMGSNGWFSLWLWLLQFANWKMAIEGVHIFPLKRGGSFHNDVNVYQRVPSGKQTIHSELERSIILNRSINCHVQFGHVQ